MTAPLVVLDTNCLVSALLFSRANLRWLREGWQSGRFIPLVSPETADELIRVLAYPKFRLDAGEQETLLADFLPYAQAVRAVHPPEGLPDIPDPDDLKFLALAMRGKAAAVVSGDRDILGAKGKMAGVLIFSLPEFRTWLERAAK